MTGGPSPARPSGAPWLLRRADQLAVGGLVGTALVALAAWWVAQGGLRGQLVEIEHAPPKSARFEVDINTAGWPELLQLPGIGETLAKRIVDSRHRQGLFLDHQDLLRVRGIGPKTLELVRPYLRPMPDHRNVADQNHLREGVGVP
jgi:competence protein ComEA